jgi:hypothetical protein
MSGIKESELTADEVKAAALAACDSAETGASAARAQLAALAAALETNQVPSAFGVLRDELTTLLRQIETTASEASKQLGKRSLTLQGAQQVATEAARLQVQVRELGARVAASLSGVGESIRLQALLALLQTQADRLGRWDAAWLDAQRIALEALSLSAVKAARAGSEDAALPGRRAALEARVTAFQTAVERREGLERRRAAFMADVREVARAEGWLTVILPESDPNREIRIRLDTGIYGDILVRLPLHGGMTTESGDLLVELSATPATAPCVSWVEPLQAGLMEHGWKSELRFPDGTPATRKGVEQRSLPQTQHRSACHGE